MAPHSGSGHGRFSRVSTGMKLKTKVLLLFTVSSVTVVSVFAVIAYRLLWQERVDGIAHGVGQQMEGFDFSLASFFRDLEGDLTALTELETIRLRDDSRFTSFLEADESTFTYHYTAEELAIIRILDSYRRTHPHVNSVYMGRENGSFVRSHPLNRAIPYDPRVRPWYTLARENPGRVMKTRAYPSLTTADINIGVVKALLDERGEVFGVVGMDVTLVNLTHYILSFRLRPPGRILVIDQDGVILASQEEGWAGQALAEYEPGLTSQLERGRMGATQVEVRGRRSHLFQHHSAEQGWRILVLVEAEAIAKEVRPAVLGMAGSLTAGLLLLSLFTLAGLHFLVIRPLRNLTREAAGIAQTGNLDHRIPIASQDETGELAQAFNRMVESLGNSQRVLLETDKALKASRDQLEERVRQRTSELQTTLGELSSAKERAEAADRLKSAFLATMSHELRTPLNSIIGFTGILLQGLAGPLNPEQQKQLGMVAASSRHLLTLINDVLDISKIEAGQLEVHLQPFDLKAAVERTIAVVHPLAEKKGLRLLCQVDPGVTSLVSDQRRLEQVLLNLLNNAIKFTESGTVSLVVSRQLSEHPAAPTHPRPEDRGGAEREAGEAVLLLAVSDTGIGIGPEDIPTLFQPFRQIDTGLARRHEGTGLGLAICHRLVQMLGGCIHVESAPGKGSVFTVTLPLAPDAPTPLEKAPP